MATPERAEHEKGYLKSDLQHLGCRVPDIRKVAKAWAKAHPDATHREIWQLVDACWATRIHEMRTVAVELLVACHRHVTAGDLDRLEQLLRESRTWALIDAMAVNVVGALLAREPEPVHRALDRWATDDDFWVRRTAMLALLPGLRTGSGDFPRFARCADAMLDETEFFIRKAIGWILREASKKAPQRVIDWLAPRTHRASGVTMREAVKYLDDKTRDELMAAYKAGEPARPPS